MPSWVPSCSRWPAPARCAESLTTRSRGTAWFRYPAVPRNVGAGWLSHIDTTSAAFRSTTDGGWRLVVVAAIVRDGLRPTTAWEQ